jgi:Rps23 Pro-64 3,4-dihydroxylase Tpa1-like proline 4-hydroxylase
MNEQRIIKNIKPFPYLIIENMYSDDELKLIWQELEFLSYRNKLKPPEKSGSAKIGGEYLKNNSGLYLDDLYSDRSISNILSINPKLYSSNIIEAFSDICFGYGNISHTNYDTTLISYYENGGYYKPHTDIAIYTSVTWFYKEPKCFSGGDFNFNQYDVKVKIKNNTTMIFPSFVEHSVDEIVMDTKEENFGKGRYCMTQFSYIQLDAPLPNYNPKINT